MGELNFRRFLLKIQVHVDCIIAMISPL